jgi:hypothetical protein
MSYGLRDSVGVKIVYEKLKNQPISLLLKLARQGIIESGAALRTRLISIKIKYGRQ